MKTKTKITDLFPKTPEAIQNLVKASIEKATQDIEKIISINDKDRTFENTVKKIDALFGLSDLSMASSTLTALEMLSPDEKIREASHNGILEIQKFSVDNLWNNVQLYKALKAYSQGNADTENLAETEKYFITETLRDFQRLGLDLPEDKLQQVKTLQKELAELELIFETNIATDKSSVALDKDELAGLEQDFIQSLKKTEDGKYILGVDYPTYFNVMQNCDVETTRKKLHQAFKNRAYPKNEEILTKIIEKRDQLAKLIGFESYSHLELDSQMAKTPERVEKFLSDLLQKANTKEQKEFEIFTKKLPNSVKLTDGGKIKPWDMGYIKSCYKKKNFNIDEREIAQYFPMENTIEQLLAIYEQFLNLEFKQVPIDGLWHDEVKLILLQQAQDERILGYLLLDLYPRANKFSHACQLTVVPAVKGNGPSLALIVANFPKSTKNKPSLLQRQDVETFFHEFGHAIHAILGRTDIASFSGTNVKTDFVETPSQMLEEWISDKEMLKKISSHYKTGESLPDEIIDKIISLKNFDSGGFLQRQCCLSLLCLEYFKDGANKNPKEIYQKINKSILKNIVLDDKDNMHASFGHLAGYGAKYYSYMWSKVFAIDLFSKIKKDGLLNPKIGQKYIDEVIGKGGSQDPNLLLKTFLEREPNEYAFLENLELL